jgi:hypothetical protein
LLFCSNFVYFICCDSHDARGVCSIGAFGLLGLLGYWVLGLFVTATLLALLPLRLGLQPLLIYNRLSNCSSEVSHSQTAAMQLQAYIITSQPRCTRCLQHWGIWATWALGLLGPWALRCRRAALLALLPLRLRLQPLLIYNRLSNCSSEGAGSQTAAMKLQA